MVRTAYSPILRDGMDVSAAVCDRDGHMVAQGTCIAMHLGSVPDATVSVCKKVSGDITPGDFLSSMILIRVGCISRISFFFEPVFIGAALFSYIVFVGHQVDIGGLVPRVDVGNSPEKWCPIEWPGGLSAINSPTSHKYKPSRGTQGQGDPHAGHSL